MNASPNPTHGPIGMGALYPFSRGPPSDIYAWELRRRTGGRSLCGGRHLAVIDAGESALWLVFDITGSLQVALRISLRI